jgi:hypothetical protein
VNLYETTSMEMLHTRILCAQVGNRTRDLQATMSMLLQLATKPHPPTIGARQHASDPLSHLQQWQDSTAKHNVNINN